jgi:methionine aminopeptidase
MLALFNAGNKAVGIMKAGQTFTIEPMINAGKFMYYIALSMIVCGLTIGLQ